MDRLKQQLRQLARAAGLRVGFASVDPLPHALELQQWLGSGMAAQMDYMARDPQARHRPERLLPAARTAIVAALSHAPGPPRVLEAPPGHGAVARYARGLDYHAILRLRLEGLLAELDRLAGRAVQGRVAVDTSPLLERELAAAAGLGFIGKNTMLITPGTGSYTVLGVLLVDLELPPDARDPVRRCGRCTLCLEACPTGALVAPHRLDARRCISYLTIEHRGEVDPDLAARFNPWIFGCDRCQEVCPYNARAASREPGDPQLAGPPLYPLASWLGLRSGAYRRLVRGRALARTPRAGLIRNAALVAGGQLRAGMEAHVEAELREALEGCLDRGDEGVRRAVRWALG